MTDFKRKRSGPEAETERLKKKILQPEAANPFLKEKGSTPVKSAVSLLELLKRPEITYDDTAVIDDVRPELSDHQKIMMEVHRSNTGDYIIKQK